MNNLIVLTGPTAVGKTDISIQLAKAIGGEIISADSMQVYKYMDIGSAKVKKEDMGGITHHLIDIIDPKDGFDVTMFKKLALEAIADIYSRGHIPIIVGGTGFYIQAILYDIDFSNNEDVSIYRKELENIASEGGAIGLHDRLAKVDPEAAKNIHPNNTKRVIRALEYYKNTGNKISAHNNEQRKHTSPYNFAYLVLNDDRDKLYQRIDLRVDRMLEEGLLEEVRHLKDMGLTRDMVSMQGIGYKELLAYLDEEYSLEDAIYIVKRDSRRYAKRQLTWFRREKDVTWLDRTKLGENSAILEFIIDLLKKRGIL